MTVAEKIKLSLPHLTTEELWLCEKDCHRAADACALGGGSSRRWNSYCELEHMFHEERKSRNEDDCEVKSFVTSFTQEELVVLTEAWRKIREKKFVSKKGNTQKKGEKSNE